MVIENSPWLVVTPSPHPGDIWEVPFGPGLSHARDLLESGDEVPAVMSLAPFNVSEEV